MSGLTVYIFFSLCQVGDDYQFPLPPTLLEFEFSNNTSTESSINNSAPHNVSDPADFTFLEVGYIRGGDMLFDKEGFSYIIKRRNMGYNNSKFCFPKAYF